jgi:hypothetical protein
MKETVKFNSELTHFRKLIRDENFTNSLPWTARFLAPDLCLKIKQKAICDTDLFEFLMLLIKLVLQKTYKSIDFEKVFKVRYDNERKNATDFDKNNKLKRLIVASELEWGKIKQTPLIICKRLLDTTLELCLDLIYYGVKGNPSNVRKAAEHTDVIYYLYTFFRRTAKLILLEVSKHMNYSDESHVFEVLTRSLTGYRKLRS